MPDQIGANQPRAPAAQEWRSSGSARPLRVRPHHSGIGRETALQFGREGASVVLAARNEQALERAAREVERLGGEPLAVPTDVSEWEQVQALADQGVQRFGRIDTWVNNAAVNEYARLSPRSAAATGLVSAAVMRQAGCSSS